MLKKYKNLLLNDIIKHEFQLNTFDAYEKIQIDTYKDQNEYIFQIDFKKTKLFFQIVNPPDNFHNFSCSYSTFSPAFSIEVYPTGLEVANFDQVREIFSFWLKAHVIEYLSEINTPDLWTQLKNQEPLIHTSLIGKEDTSQFTDEEKLQIKLSIIEFKDLVINNFNPSDEEIILINDRLDYLTNALDRLNRFDWRGVVLNTLLSISIALSLDADKGQILFQLFKQVFTKVVHLIQ